MDTFKKDIEELKKLILQLNISQREIISLEEACIFLALSKSALYKLTSGKIIPHFVPNGKKIYFKKSELIIWVENGRVTQTVDIGDKVDAYLCRNNKV